MPGLLFLSVVIEPMKQPWELLNTVTSQRLQYKVHCSDASNKGLRTVIGMLFVRKVSDLRRYTAEVHCRGVLHTAEVHSAEVHCSGVLQYCGGALRRYTAEVHL